MNGKIYKASKELSNFVQSYWTLDFRKEDTPQINTIIPDGMMKMIFHYGDRYWHHPEDGEKFLQANCFVIGQLTKPYIVEPSGDTGTFVVRFHPNGFLPFATLAIKDMENTPVPLEELYGQEGLDLAREMLEASETGKRIEIIEGFLLTRLMDSKRIDEIVQSTVDTILTGNGQVSVAELSKANKINRRQLVRKFSSAIGLSPKQLSKTVRLQATLKTLIEEEKSKLTDVAYQGEFYDQSHFIKDFKEFTGYSPKDFYVEHLQMSLIFDKMK